MLKFTVTILAAAIIIALALWIGVSAFSFTRPSFYAATLVLLTFITITIFFYLSKDNLRGVFLQLYLLSMVVKLLAYCAYNLIMVLKDRQGALSNVVFFMITYFIFTALEIGFLYHKITRVSKP